MLDFDAIVLCGTYSQTDPMHDSNYLCIGRYRLPTNLNFKKIGINCRQPEKLDELNLDAFAEELERQGFGNKQITLYDIRTELNEMYKDNR